MNREVVGVGLSGPGETAYVPVAHRDEEIGRLRPDQLPLAEVIQALDLHRRPLVGHDTKIAASVLRDRGGCVPHFAWDTMLAAKLLPPHLPADLHEVARRGVG